jgi:hypothetical protein
LESSKYGDFLNSKIWLTDISSLQAVAVEINFLGSIRKQTRRDKIRSYEDRKSTRLICETIRVMVWTCFNIWMRTQFPDNIKIMVLNKWPIRRAGRVTKRGKCTK